MPKGGSSAALARLRQLIGRGLERTAPLWPDVERAYAWVHSAAHVLGNDKGEDAVTTRRRFDGLVAAMRQHRDSAARWLPPSTTSPRSPEATDLCRKHGISDATFYTWRSKYGGMEVSDARS